MNLVLLFIVRKLLIKSENDSEVLINAGSSSLSQFIFKNSSKIIMNLHGHVHRGQGLSRCIIFI